jgi:hypothetical protein
MAEQGWSRDLPVVPRADHSRTICMPTCQQDRHDRDQQEELACADGCYLILLRLPGRQPGPGSQLPGGDPHAWRAGTRPSDHPIRPGGIGEDGMGPGERGLRNGHDHVRAHRPRHGSEHDGHPRWHLRVVILPGELSRQYSATVPREH